MEYLSPKEAIETLIDKYCGKRDIEGVLASVTEDIEWLGSAEGAIVSGKKELENLLEKEFKNFPEALHVEAEIYRERELAPGLVFLNLRGRQHGIPGVVNSLNLRGGAVAKKTEDGWLICVFHASTPSTEVEKYKLEQELDAIKRKQQVLLSSVPGGVGLYRLKKDGRMATDYLSDSVAHILGYTPSELMDIIGYDALPALVKEDVPQAVEDVKEALATGKVLHTRFRLKTKAGGEILFYLDANFLKDVKLLEDDVAAMYAVQYPAREESKLYRSVVEDSAIGVLVADRESQTIVYINKAAMDVYGFEKNMHPVGLNLKEQLVKLGRKPLIERSDLFTLSFDEYIEFHIERGSRYFGVKAKAVMWNGIDSYILYITDETSEHNEQVQLQSLIDGVPGGMGIYEVTSKEVKLLYLNKAYYEMLGFGETDKKNIRDYDGMDIVHPEDRKAVLEYINKIRQGADKVDEVHRVHNKKGEWIWVHFWGSVVERIGDRCLVYAAVSNCDDLMRAEQELIAAHQKEQSLISSIPGGVAIYRVKKSGLVETEYVSEGLAKMCGWEYEAFKEYLKKDALINVRREDIPLVMKAAQQSLETKMPISVIYHIHVKNSTDILTRLEANIIEDKALKEDDVAVWYAVHTNVSEEVQNALEEQQRYRTVMEGLDLAFLEWDREKGFYASDKYKEYALSDQPYAAVFSNSADKSVVHPEDLELLQHFFTETNSNSNRSSVTLRLKMKDGSYKWTEIMNFCYLDNLGKVIRSVGIMRDVDKEKIEQNEKLRQALMEAKRANQAKTSFLSRVSHDMRTPLNGILGTTELMRSNTTDKATLHDLYQLEISGKYLLNLINDTLDVSKIESGKLALKPRPVEGKSILNDVFAMIKPNMERKKINFVVKAEALPYSILYVDAGRLEQIFMNILSNAVKFTPDGGRVEFSIRNINVHNGVILDEVVIKDSGIGMSKEFLPHIFEAFTQEDSAITSSRQGTGLGMSITKQLLELMGGGIKVESELGKGTTFTVTLPLVMATNEQITEYERTHIADHSKVSLENKRILLCEDHPINAEIAKRLLAKRHIQVDHAENGKEGLEMFAASPERYYDAILMDVRMPVMDGIEATRRIRVLDRKDAQLVPIIAMTANAFDEDAEETRKAGMNAHLGKPVDSAKLFATLEDTLSALGGKKPIVLIVDDMELNRKVMKSSLEKSYTIIEANDGQEALSVLKQHPFIDCIITDLEMPVMNGRELIRSIRSQKKYNHIAIIANTQFGDPSQEEALLEMGADDFVYKPTSPKIVKFRVATVLKKK